MLLWDKAKIMGYLRQRHCNIRWSYRHRLLIFSDSEARMLIFRDSEVAMLIFRDSEE